MIVRGWVHRQHCVLFPNRTELKLETLLINPLHTTNPFTSDFLIMSAVLRPLSQLLLRTSVSSTPKAIRSIPQSLGRKSSWCRRRHSATRRFSNTTKTTTFLFQEHSASGDGGDSAEELCLSDSCVQVYDIYRGYLGSIVTTALSFLWPQQLHKVTEEEPGLVLRVMVDGGGCSGFQYKIEFDTKINSDDK